MGKHKIAIATNRNNGLEDVISSVFGRAKTFTITDIENGKIERVKVVENSAVSYHHGAGPIVIKMLMDKGVNMVLSNELGIGAADLLKQFDITHIQVKPGTNVKEVIKNALHMHKKEVDVK